MPAPLDPMKRSAADGILEAVTKGGSIQIDTLKTIDNQDGALETIRRLKGVNAKCMTRSVR